MNRLDSAEVKNLCIIGNGFDIHHGLETNYTDFRLFLMNNKKGDFVNQLESFFQAEFMDEKGRPGFLLWSNLEEAIGKYDLDGLYHELTDWIEIDYDHMGRSSAQIEDAPYDFLEPIVESLPKMVGEWIGQVSLYGLLPDVDFPDSSVFLTFNYTRVLEDVYHILEDQILHIHGVIGDDLIVGHRERADERTAYEEDAPIFQDESKKNIIRIMNACRKPTEDIIYKNRVFFKLLHDVADIYVYGHSYSFVDFDYYKRILESVSDGAMWHLGYHNDYDKKAAAVLMNELGITRNSWQRFMF